MSEEMTQDVKKDFKVSDKSRGIAALLCFLFGWAGAHRYYTGKIGTGLMMLFTMGGFGMWWFIDLIMVTTGKYKDRDELPLTNWKLA